LELTRYIYLNPLRAGIVKGIKALNKYKWYGHSVIMGNLMHKWQDKDRVLGYFGKRQKTALKKI